MPNQLQDFLTFAASIVTEALPFVILGIIISVAVQVWLPDNWLRWLPKRRGLRQITVSLIGAGVAALVQVAVPREVLVALGSDSAWSIIAMLTLAFIVSICSNVDAFFALAFKDAFMAGSLVSFLTFGPMIDIKLLSMMRTTYRSRVLAQVSLLVLLLSAAIGLVVNYVF